MPEFYMIIGRKKIYFFPEFWGPRAPPVPPSPTSMAFAVFSCASSARSQGRNLRGLAPVPVPLKTKRRYWTLLKMYIWYVHTPLQISKYAPIKVKKGKDVDLYSASHVQDTSNAHFVTETEPPGRFEVTAHSLQTQACSVTQQPATGSASQQ